jgi:acyl-CoA dehydrogenase
MESFGWLANALPSGMGWTLALVVAVGLGFVSAPLVAWTVFTAAACWLLGVPLPLTALVVAALAFMNLVPLRRALVSTPLAKLMDKLGLMPVISDTERIALEAGTTWVDAELFSGRPDFNRMRKEAYPKVSAEEQAFLDNQVMRVCSMVTDWEVFQLKDLPQPVWDYLKKEGFFGMIIPKEYGGLGFSALGHSEVIARLATHCVTLCVSCMVPNSLGPGELLIHYGTKKQREYYLPRLARGEEVPCFGLTEPNAGSDAGSIQSSGVICRGADGQLMIKLNWEKRYITLAAVSTLIGLAVRLFDPENLLGKGKDLGITCVLVPASTPGVVLGRRHNAMGVPFYNCPTHGHDVTVSVDQIIGGADGAGRGWQMLMECLAAGRAISLPSQSAGGAKGLVRLASAYAVVRRQFGVPIGAFEGIEEPLARITGLSYLMEATRLYTVGAVDSGMKPAVVSAIAKYNQTELARKLLNDGMDLMGGAAISRGPRNKIANSYIGAPISITVEGANILTRTMIIFGQGAIRCHPFAYKEVKALQQKDYAAFDSAFWGHIGHVVRNSCRALALSVTRGYLAGVPGGPGARYYRKLAWASATFAIMSDIAMGTLGGTLKLKEKLTGRYADVLSWMYLASATLRRYEAEGYREDHRPVFEWAMQHSLAQIQQAFVGIFENFDVPVPVLGALFRGPLAFWARLNTLGRQPSDRLGHKIAQAIQYPGTLRDSLTTGIIISAQANDAGARLERAFLLAHQSTAVLAKISKAVKAKQLPKKRANLLVREATEAKIITPEEARLLDEANAAREDAIQVDSFSLEEFKPTLLDLAEGAGAYRGRTAGRVV